MSGELYDITIIGSGPAGLYGAFYAGMRGMKTKILDSLPELGGQLVALYPEKWVFDVGGFPKILAKDLARNLIEQALTFQPTICLSEKVTSVKILDDSGRHFEITTDKGSTHSTKTLVLTAGIGAFKPKRLDLPGVREFEGKGVYYFVNEKRSFMTSQFSSWEEEIRLWIGLSTSWILPATLHSSIGETNFGLMRRASRS